VPAGPCGASELRTSARLLRPETITHSRRGRDIAHLGTSIFPAAPAPTATYDSSNGLSQSSYSTRRRSIYEARGVERGSPSLMSIGSLQRSTQRDVSVFLQPCLPHFGHLSPEFVGDRQPSSQFGVAYSGPILPSRGSYPDLQLLYPPHTTSKPIRSPSVQATPENCHWLCALLLQFDLTVASWLVVRLAITSNAHFLTPGKAPLLAPDPCLRKDLLCPRLTVQKWLPWNSRCIIHANTMGDVTHVNAICCMGGCLLKGEPPGTNQYRLT
jgi:hypothetical protein